MRSSGEELAQMVARRKLNLKREKIKHLPLELLEGLFTMLIINSCEGIEVATSYVPG